MSRLARIRPLIAIGAASLLGASAFVVGPAAPLGAASGDLTTFRESVSSAGAQLTSDSQNPSVSANGRYVAFDTGATNAVTPFTDGNADGTDVYVRDRLTGTTTLVSVSTVGASTSGNGGSSNPVISADGRFVVFQSTATDLVSGFVDGNGAGSPDVFVRAWQATTPTTTLVSALPTDAKAGGDDSSTAPSISGDGQSIAFQSAATDLVTGYSADGATTDVFVRSSGTTSLVSAAVTTTKTGGDGDSTEPSISANAKMVVFTSAATNLLTGFTDNNTTGTDVFERDLAGGTTAVVSAKLSDSKGGGTGIASHPSASANGRYVAFQSTQGSDLLTGFTKGNASGETDVFTRDVRAGATWLTSPATGSTTTGANGESSFASISGDGGKVAFSSVATNLVSPATSNGFTNVFVRDRNLATTITANVGPAGVAADGDTGTTEPAPGPVMSFDGHYVAYSSGAANLVAGDTNTAMDVFLTVLRAPGYWLDATDGGIFAYNAPFFGSTGAMTLNKPMVGMAPYPDGEGYWLVASDGGIFSFPASGHANLFFGSTGAMTLNKPILGMAAYPDQGGYWLVASDGGIFSFPATGHANLFFGSTGAMTLNKPIVGMAPTPTGRGYWLVASDGGIFSFGDAVFFGSTGAITLNKPIVGMTATPTGDGYWLVASDGGIFSFGDAAFQGSTGAITLNKPIVGMAATSDGLGYWLVASDGGIFAFGDAPFFGSAGNIALNKPIVGMAAR